MQRSSEPLKSSYKFRHAHKRNQSLGNICRLLTLTSKNASWLSVMLIRWIQYFVLLRRSKHAYQKIRLYSSFTSLMLVQG